MASATPGAAPEGAVSRGTRTRATVLLVALRIAYAYNWFSIGPALPSLSSEFGLAPSSWGELVAAFLIGAGLFQVPSGLLARRYGTRTISIIGAVLLGAAAVASAAAPSFDTLLVVRFLGGAGAGLFFSPAIGLVASLHQEGQRGIPVGVFSSAFSAGAGLGVFATALLIPEVGWRLALLVGGASLLLLVLPALWAIPRNIGRPGPSRPPPGWPIALRSRAVWVIGVAFIGLEGASLSAGQYFVPYAESVRGWTPALAGAVGALFVFPSTFGGPVGGRLLERYGRRRTQMVLTTAAGAVTLIAIPFVGLAGVVGIGIVFSVSYGMVYAMMYVLAPYLPGLPTEEVPLAIGLFNGLQLSGGAAVAVLAAVLVDRLGYTPAWEALGLLTLVPLALLVLVPITRPGRPGTDPAATSP